MFETSKSQSKAAESKATGALSLRDSQEPESRLDPITGQWTIFAPHRGDRPDEFVLTSEKINRSLICPFCSGNEPMTPPPLWVGRIHEGQCLVNADDRGNDDWSVRVVPNLYPAVTNAQSEAEPLTKSKLFVRRPVFGGHDVFIESRQHVPSFSQLDLAEVQLTFLAYRDRIRCWKEQPEVSYISVFKNVGEKAGASLRHCHSQLIATDRVPIGIEGAVHRMQRYRAETGCCLHCDLIRGEQKSPQRIVWQNESLIAFCPFASRLPMLLRITSQQHQACFEDLDEGLIEAVSRLVYRAVAWLETIRPETAYNLCLSTRPPGIDDPSDSFHWSIDLFPRMTQMAGFEWSSGCMINPMLPEAAAAKYRKLAQAENPRQP